MLFENLYQKNMYFKHGMLFFHTKTVIVCKKKTWQIHTIFYNRKSKKNLLLEICKCFFKKTKNSAKSLFLLRGDSAAPSPLAMDLN